MGVKEESYRDWASQIVLVPKTDGFVWFFVDNRKVNAVSKFDAYPMLRFDKLLDRLGTARFYSTLDLTKGYWLIAFIQRKNSLHNAVWIAPIHYTSVRVIRGSRPRFSASWILRPHAAYAAAHLEDIIIYSNEWHQHMEHLRAVLRALSGARLTDG